MTMRKPLSGLFFGLAACSGSSLEIGGSPDAVAGDATSVDARACAIDDFTGIFAVSYTRQSGDCGALAAAEYQLVPDVLWNTPGCTVQHKVTSTDRCVSTGSADCIVGESREHIEGSISQTSSEALDGVVSITVTSEQGTCTGTYAIAYRRK